MRDVGMGTLGSPQVTPSSVDEIGNILESSFCGENSPFDFPIPPTVLSTIAIALSPNGETVATTHGDHTVKIHDYESGIVKQVFVGHPRTPWTVKYHPYNSNIIASGCLGFQVRVWDLIDGVHLTTVRYDFSIISVSFHPFLPILAIASGPKLHIFNWQDGLSKHKIETINEATEQFRNSRNHSVESSGFDSQLHTDAKSPTSVLSGVAPGSTSGLLPQNYHIVQHCRNIRAVLFHPNGKYLLTAAPDPPKSQGTFTSCRLYFYSVDCLRIGSEESRSVLTPRDGDGSDREAMFDSSGNEIVKLVRMPYLLDQIHLYSDGGLDISEDGEYLFTCSILTGGVIGGPFGTDSPRSRGSGFIGFGRPNGQHEADSMLNTKRSFDQLLLTNPTPPRPGAAGAGFSSLVRDSNATVVSSGGRKQSDGGLGEGATDTATAAPDQRYPLPVEFQKSGGRPTSAVPHQNLRRFPHLKDSLVVAPTNTENPPQQAPPVPLSNQRWMNFPMFGDTNAGGNTDNDDDNDDFDEDGDDDDLDTGGGQWTAAAGDSNSHRWNSLPPPVLNIHGGGMDSSHQDQAQQKIYSHQNQHLQSSQPVTGTKYNYGPSTKTTDYLCLFKLVNIKTYTSEASDRGRVGYSSFVAATSAASDPDDEFVLSPIVPKLCAAKPLTGALCLRLPTAAFNRHILSYFVICLFVCLFEYRKPDEGHYLNETISIEQVLHDRVWCPYRGRCIWTLQF